MAVRKPVKRKPVKRQSSKPRPKHTVWVPIGQPNPKVPIVDLTKRVVSSGKLAGSGFHKKKVDPAQVEKEWKRYAVIHNVRQYGAPVQRMLRDEFETAFWRGVARSLLNPWKPNVKFKVGSMYVTDKPASIQKLSTLFKVAGYKVEIVDYDGQKIVVTDAPASFIASRKKNPIPGVKRYGATGRNNPEGPGSKISWRDPISRKTLSGTVLSFGKSSKKPWNVYTVKTDAGSVVEIHADRIVQRSSRRNNPEGPASELYEKFHGKPSERIDIVEEAVHYHEHLTALGDLVELKIKTPTKIRATLRFPDEGAPTLASSEDGRQLFVVGGDQKVNLRDIEMDSAQWRRDMMDLGELLEVTYHTVKGFHRFEPTNYFHKLGEETGVKPRILYDTRNERLLVAGGQYAVKPEGIVN